MIHPLPSRRLTALRRSLVTWFTDHARDLPWRRVPTPYNVWVSEIMCQQTQVATVVPYFQRFLERYPDAHSLAQADESELMRMWEGLGYYRRARSMHAAAKEIVARHNGQFPTAFADVLALPGIGRYTTGAILSIAHNQRAPILEGNTIRVFSRLLGMRESVDEKASLNRLWQFAETLLPVRFDKSDRQSGPATINQAAMELGALICLPREPKCLICPLAKWCVARTQGWQSSIPVKTQKIAYEARNEFAFLIAGPANTWLVRQTPPETRFAGMWDFPKAGPPEVSDVHSLKDWLTSQLGGAIRLGEPATEIKHAVTKYRITLTVFHAEWTLSTKKPPDLSPPPPWAFRSGDELRHLPMSITGRRLLAWAEKQTQRGMFG